MSIFDTVGGIITSPFKAVGKLLQADPIGFLGELGRGAQSAAPFLPFVPGIGAPAAMLVGAGGSALSSLDPPEVDPRTKARSGEQVPRVRPTPPLPSAVTTGSGNAAATNSGGGMNLQGVGSWLSQNAPLITGLAGTGADIYSAHKRSQEMDRQMAFQEEEARRQREQQQLAMLMSTMAQMRPRY